MKTIEATVPASMLEEVAHLLIELEAYAMTATEARGYGRPDGRRDLNRGSAHELDGVPTVQVEMIVDDEMVPAVVAAIMKCRKGCGDGCRLLIATVGEVIPNPSARQSTSRPPRPARTST